MSWTYAKDGMPTELGFYLIALRSVKNDRGPWVPAKIYFNWPGVSDPLGFDVPLVRWGKAEVYAWQRFDFPQAPPDPEAPTRTQKEERA